MKDRINVAELLRNCPKGMELDCTIWDNCTFEGIEDVGYINILVKTPNGLVKLSKEGYLYHNHSGSKCVIFPKGKTTWEGFVPPCKFKDGDVVTSVFQGVVQGTGIFEYEEQSEAWIHVCVNLNNEFFTDGYLGHVYDLRLATEEEKEKLFKAIKKHGCKWNPETKNLEKLIELKFQVGDRIRNKKTLDMFVITHIDEDSYYCGLNVFWICDQDDYELVPNKFDINTLKPFDKVLVRDFDNTTWEIELFSRLLDGKHFKCFDLSYVQCIPYEGNEHLLGKKDNCHEYFKNWK